MSNNTWTHIREHADIKANINAASSFERLAELRALYRAKNKIVKRSVKHEKRNRIDALASAAQTAANIGDISAVYKISSTNIEHPVNGYLLLSDEEQMLRWRSHFSSVLNHHLPENVTIYHHILDISRMKTNT